MLPPSEVNCLGSLSGVDYTRSKVGCVDCVHLTDLYHGLPISGEPWCKLGLANRSRNKPRTTRHILTLLIVPGRVITVSTRFSRAGVPRGGCSGACDRFRVKRLAVRSVANLDDGSEVEIAGGSPAPKSRDTLPADGRNPPP